MITLHHCPQTRSMRTLWLLHELGVPFEVKTWPFDKRLRSEAFLQLNPAGRVPAIEMDGKYLWETGAITEILCERFPEAGLGRGIDHPERPEWLIWLHFAETVSQHTAALTQQHIVLYDDEMRSPIVMQLEAKRLEKCFQAIDQRVEGRLTLLHEGFSAADISVGQAVYMARHFARLEPFGNALTWYKSITARPAFQAALPQEPKLYQKDFYPAWGRG